LFSVWKQIQLHDSKTMLHALRVNFENLGHTKSLVLRSAKSFTSRKILFFVVWPKFLKFTRNACGMVLLSSR